MTFNEGLKAWVEGNHGTVQVRRNLENQNIFEAIFTAHGERPAATGFFWNRAIDKDPSCLDVYFQQLKASGKLEEASRMARMSAKS